MLGLASPWRSALKRTARRQPGLHVAHHVAHVGVAQPEQLLAGLIRHAAAAEEHDISVHVGQFVQVVGDLVEGYVGFGAGDLALVGKMDVVANTGNNSRLMTCLLDTQH